ncbi:hypothetical protein ATCC90586_007254 [Pythium insidiosum]|nr:hypothetical protein ATCC90586_007254 [Pythium insidiosum]
MSLKSITLGFVFAQMLVHEVESGPTLVVQVGQYVVLPRRLNLPGTSSSQLAFEVSTLDERLTERVTATRTLTPTSGKLSLVIQAQRVEWSRILTDESLDVLQTEKLDHRMHDVGANPTEAAVAFDQPLVEQSSAKRETLTRSIVEP